MREGQGRMWKGGGRERGRSSNERVPRYKWLCGGITHGLIYLLPDSI